MGHETAQSQVVKNGGTNFSLYYNVLNYFKTIMNNHPSIGHVTQGDIFSIDTREFPMYPIGNVLISNATFGTSTTDYRVQLIVADKVKNGNDDSFGASNSQTIPFFGYDDMVDIHANTLSVLNDLTAYTQRSVDGFEINGDISCTPFADRFDNGLSGWSAEFDLTVHNDKNRCLFFLINPSGSGYVIEDCDSGEHFLAVFKEGTEAEVGQVFTTILRQSYYNPKLWLETYDYLRCFTITETFENRDNYDFVNLPILALPFEDFQTCETCDLWISPKIWSTTPERWGVGVDRALRKWRFT
jgi:hypothetical protein